tara:strand:- start:641 stop:1129 length:489 start_codon:yes stop_codon:yes gene_type:complete
MTVSTDLAFRKFKHIVSDTLKKHQDNVIIKTKDDFKVFKDFTISRLRGCYQVYRNDDFVHEFATGQNAIAYCVLAKYNKDSEAQNIIQNDNKISSLKTEIRVQEHITETTDDELRRDLMWAKISNNELKLESAEFRLQDMIDLAKYCQAKGFRDETSRTSKK